LRSDGTNERALQIMRLNASGQPAVRTEPANHFITPLFQSRGTSQNIRAFDPVSGFNALDHITLPAHLTGVYRSQTFRLSGAIAKDAPIPENIIQLNPEDEPEIIEGDTDWSDAAPEHIDRQLVDEVTVTQR
jgi:hypothetical protein